MAWTRRRRRLAEALDPELNPMPGLSALNMVLLGLILASIVVGILETEPALHDRWGGFFWAAEALFLVAFSIEFAARVSVATFNPRHRTVWSFLFTWTTLIDIIVLVTLLLPFLGLETTLLRMVRALRILRLARLGRFSLALRHLSDALSERRYELVVGLGAAGLVLLFAATMLYALEGGVQPDAFGSIPRALWWAVATLTTVGYGDVVPVTGLGRMMAALTAFAGIAVIAIPAGVIAAAFSDVIRAAREAAQAERRDDDT